MHSVPPGIESDRLDRYAASVFAALASRKAAYKAVKSGRLRVDGRGGRPQEPVSAGMCLVLVPPSRREPVLDLHLEVPWQDDCAAVVVKPPGIPVSGNYARTLTRALPANLVRSSRADALGRAHPVHRLDAPTGGLLLVGKTGSALRALSLQFEGREIGKRYLAVVAGRLEGEGWVREPVEGRAAATRYRVVGHTRSLRTEWLSTVEAEPQTGRRHQIRRHLAALGHPIVGDVVYAPGGCTLRGKGLFLWSVYLAFTHPETGGAVELALDPPPKFASLCAREARRWDAHHGEGR